MNAAAGFLQSAGWAGAATTPLAGDASARRYTRLTCNGTSAILMEDPGGDTARFARIARHLLSLGLSAPRILAEAPGLLLLEDLGDGLIARLAETQDPIPLYRVAVDALVALHQHAPPPDLPQASPVEMAAITDLSFSHYAMTPDAPWQSAFAPLRAALEDALNRHAAACDVMILRDYHAENILLLPTRDGAARAGLLDFQDAMIGHRAYDLASLIRDVRRDVAPETAQACVTAYLESTGLDDAPFRAALAVLGVQRNLRILGVFARLSREMGKPRYVAMIPRVWANLQADLAHPALAKLATRVNTDLPAPDAALLDRLKSPCPTR